MFSIQLPRDAAIGTHPLTTLQEAVVSKQSTRTPTRKARTLTVDEVRQIALSFPGVQEGNIRQPTFKVGGRMLARFLPDGQSLAIKVQLAAREVLTGAQPETFYVTDNYRCWPLMLVRLSNVSPEVLRELFEDAWRGMASKRAVAEYEAGQNLKP